MKTAFLIFIGTIAIVAYYWIKWLECSVSVNLCAKCNKQLDLGSEFTGLDGANYCGECYKTSKEA